MMQKYGIGALRSGLRRADMGVAIREVNAYFHNAWLTQRARLQTKQTVVKNQQRE